MFFLNIGSNSFYFICSKTQNNHFEDHQQKKKKRQKTSHYTACPKDTHFKTDSM